MLRFIARYVRLVDAMSCTRWTGKGDNCGETDTRCYGNKTPNTTPSVYISLYETMTQIPVRMTPYIKIIKME